MHITMGAEFALNLHIEGEPTYAQLETALVDAGFEQYTILRTVNVDATTDVQLFVRNAPGDGGMQDQLDAVDTVDKLSTAIQALEDSIAPNEPPA
jgi:hypothetical protein